MSTDDGLERCHTCGSAAHLDCAPPAEQPPATGATERPPIESERLMCAAYLADEGSDYDYELRLAICDYALELERLSGELAQATLRESCNRKELAEALRAKLPKEK